MGLARAVGAVFFAVITGLLMAWIFRKDDAARTTGQIYVPEEDDKERTVLDNRQRLCLEVSRNFANITNERHQQAVSQLCRILAAEI